MLILFTSSAPYFEKLSEEFPGVKFFKIDVDEVPGAAVQHGIRSIPTFKFYSGEQMLDEVHPKYSKKIKFLFQFFGFIL